MLSQHSRSNSLTDWKQGLRADSAAPRLRAHTTGRMEKPPRQVQRLQGGRPRGGAGREPDFERLSLKCLLDIPPVGQMSGSQFGVLG